MRTQLSSTPQTGEGTVALDLLFLSALGAVLLAWLFGKPLLVAWRRMRVRRVPFPDAWRTILKARVPAFRALPADLQLQLKKHIQVFLAEKPFIGCAGLEITDEIRVTIAAQACLLLLNRRAGYYRQLRQILVYPGAFVVNKTTPLAGGVVQEHRAALAGESWQEGQVVLSWHDTLSDANEPESGKNLVVHEFAHQLDQETGSANGAPRLSRDPLGHKARDWARVLGAEFALLQRQAAAQEPSLLSYYGATNPAEFFAVASEVFFTRPHALAEQRPALYVQLSGFYCVNPLSWR
jgi:MtfA peptidase